jgi:membrane-associated protein
LFVAGLYASKGDLNIVVLNVLLSAMAILGDATSYTIGARVGPKIFSRPKSRFFKPEHVTAAHNFYEKHGGKAIVIARFVPIVRTFVPFVCGVGRLTYLRFLAFSVFGALLWVGLLVPAGFFFGNLAPVKQNLSAVILLIVLVSLLPGMLEYLRARRAAARR